MNIDGKILKVNPRMHQNNNSLGSSRFHPRDADMVRYTGIHQYNPLHKQTQRKKTHGHFIRC